MKEANSKSQLTISIAKPRKALSSQHPAIGQTKSNGKTRANLRKPTRARSKARRRRPRIDDGVQVTTFPEVKGKVVREVRFSHQDHESALAIAFKDRTVLYFQVDPTPMVLPVEIRARYIGERASEGEVVGRAREEQLATSS